MSEINKTKYNFDNGFSRTMDWASLFILLICFSGLAAIITYLTLHEAKPIKNEVNIITDISKKDTVTTAKFKDYLNKLDTKITELQSVESNLDKKLDEINTFYKFLGTIIAIIIAITGFFGFKSLHELKIRNLENAKEVAKNEAIIKVETELQNLKDKTISKIEEAKSESKLSLLSDYYKRETQIEALTGNIKEINSRLDVIENLERDFEDFNLRLIAFENESINEESEVSKKKNISSLKKKDLSTKISNEIKEDKNTEVDEFGEEGFES